LRGFKRQALHAATLGFDHPRSGKRLTLQSPVPPDFAQLLEVLREDARAAASDAAEVGARKPVRAR
jgi:23S rRNA pseudouridine1911/1915/1917 synthase